MKVGVNIAIVNNHQVLLTKRKDFGVWCLPGGHVESEESITQAAIRETLEETGIEVRLERLIGLYSIPKAKAWVNLIVLFSGNQIGGELRVQEDEVLEMRYFGIDEIPSNLLWGHRQRILDVFSGYGGGVVWHQNVPYDSVENRNELYKICTESGLSGEEFYFQNFGWSDPIDDIKEID